MLLPFGLKSKLADHGKAHPMAKYIITCPECGAAMITESPSTTIWEICPHCRHHVMDGYDVLMAQAVPEGPQPHTDLRSKVVNN
jgi:DNA-directed RNA polymerase subunit M/transcription elongation factor TFIIS